MKYFQTCKKICKHPEIYIDKTTAREEHLAYIIDISIEFLIKVDGLNNLMKWKYLAKIAHYSKSIEKIALESTVEQVSTTKLRIM